LANFTELKQRVMNMALSEDDALAGDLVNDVYRDLVIQSQSLCNSSIEALTMGQQSYTINGDFGLADLGAIQHLLYKAQGQTQGYVLELSSFEEVLQLNSTNPTGYVVKYALQGLNRLWLWPAPQSSGDTLTVYYVENPLALLLGNDVPSAIPEQWHHLISVGAAARMVDAVGEDLNLSNMLQAKYEALYGRFTGWSNIRRGRGTQKMGQGYVRGVGFPTHDRSAYYSSQGMQ
jgi:hypothetical protein